MKRFLAAASMLGGLTVFPHYAVAQAADSKPQIERVIENFRSAIVNKDEEAFVKLFVKEDVTFAGVTTDASIERLYANRPQPQMKRPSKLYSTTPRKFIGSIVRAEAKVDEIVSNVRIESDGDVGQVWFDYSFINGNYKKMWGKESWLVVRTADGWKIAGVVSSQEFNPTPASTNEAP
jgi:ketosteroid isomerase-like protein